MTGHLVMSSLHTNDAPTTIPRLMDMGVKQFLVSAVLNLVAAQRLVRRVCDDCRASYKPDQSVIDSIKGQLEELEVPPEDMHVPNEFYKGEGCESCNGLGYRGRIGIFEVMDINDDIRQLINSNRFNLEDLRDLARENGMVTMFEDGLMKVERGMTTIDEVFRVIRE